MSKHAELHRRDRRRARVVADEVLTICCAEDLQPKTVRILVGVIAAALKREREEQNADR